VIGGEVEHLLMDSRWRLRLPPEFRRRTEDGTIVFWRSDPRETVWVDAYKSKPDWTPERTLSWLKEDAPRAPKERYERTDHGVLKHASYLLDHDDEGTGQLTLHSHSVAPDGGWLAAEFYFDSELSLPWALEAWASITHEPTS
jgi:hypothetical protein